MKSILLLAIVAFVAVATATPSNTYIDWSTVKPIYQLPGFAQRFPGLARTIGRWGNRRQGAAPMIVGGQEAENGQFPYATGLILHTASGNGWCGGSLVSDRFVMTAAHCVVNVPSGIAILGAHDYTNQLEDGQIRQFTEMLVAHPNFDASTTLNDVGLVELPTPVTFTATIRPVRLPNRRQVGLTFANQQATVNGWGTTSDSASVISNVLHFVRSQIITNLSCRTTFPLSLDDTHICMSGDDGRGICTGDSGGALTVTDADGLTTQIGIASWGSILGCETGRPSVFTRMTDYIEWIGENSNVEIRDGWDLN